VTHVYAVATHDTASAVVGVPATDEHFAYISSGTWSLIGTELKEVLITAETQKQNYTNEWGAYETIRFLKNITGMWSIQEIARMLDYQYSYQEMAEAARIDGLSEYRIFWNIMLPQVKPAIITLIILSVNGSWNDLLWPMIVTSSTEMRTLANGLALFIGQNTIEYGMAFAGALISLLPMFVLYMFGQKYFVEGMVSSGLKG